MFTISRQFTFCYAHRLQTHTGKCAHLHGHNAAVTVELQHERLNANGMVTDFIDIKNLIGNWIDETLDHRTILKDDDPLADVLRQHGEPVFTLPVDPTSENLAKLIYDQSATLGLPIVAVTLWETEKCAATYTLLRHSSRAQ